MKSPTPGSSITPAESSLVASLMEEEALLRTLVAAVRTSNDRLVMEVSQKIAALHAGQEAAVNHLASEQVRRA